MSDRNKEIVEKVNAAFEKGDTEGFLEHCSEDLDWTMVGEKHARGKSEIREWMKQMDGMEPPKFSVETFVADGDSVVCSGQMSMKTPDGGTGNYGYCDIYRFEGDKIANLTSFVIATKPEGNDTQTAAA